MSSAVHASCVSVDGNGVLIRGASGSGKSATALRLITLGAVLVADDRTILHAADSGVIATPHPAIAGRIEARGIGILTLPNLSEAKLTLIVDLCATTPERMPHSQQTRLLGQSLPLVSIQYGNGAMLDAVCLMARGAGLETG